MTHHRAVPRPAPLRWPTSRRAVGTATGLAAVLALAACGGGGGTDDDAQAPARAALTGTVAVGAPLSGATLRIVDATGAVVASDIAVDDDGRYTVPALGGTPPYRLEACGQAGPNWTCLHSVAQGPGVANVTPLTGAAALLASERQPGLLMNGSAAGLDADRMAAAQQQLRNGLAGLLAGHVPEGFDFVAGTLSAGSRTGYDRVLDSIGVHPGVDGGTTFVQITPRLGNGNLVLEPGITQGSVAADSRAATLSLASLETLFAGMSNALASADACASGLASHMASGARLMLGPDFGLSGADAVAAGLCDMFAEENLWGSRLMSPTLGRCDLDGPQPVCRVTFVLMATGGAVQQVGGRMGVVHQQGAWKFLGDLDPIALSASATVQRDRRFDGGTPVDTYSRALAFEIPAVDGLACARVTQRQADGTAVTMAIYKLFDDTAERLSLWTRDGASAMRSMSVGEGHLRSRDDTWVQLPAGEEGDQVIRNFVRGGRAVTVHLYADSDCTTAFEVDGRSEFEVDIEGVPPLWTTMSSIPWPELTEPAKAEISALSMGGGRSRPIALSWTFPRGPLGLGEAVFCADRASCGDGGAGRIGEASMRPGSTSLTMNLATSAELGVEGTGAKTFVLFGRTADGISVQANFMSCASVAEGQPCE